MFVVVLNYSLPLNMVHWHSLMTMFAEFLLLGCLLFLKGITCQSLTEGENNAFII